MGETIADARTIANKIRVPIDRYIHTLNHYDRVQTMYNCSRKYQFGLGRLEKASDIQNMSSFGKKKKRLFSRCKVLFISHLS